jgi:hypothetical protein
VVPAGSSAHGFSCSRRLSPLSGRNSTYRLVQISGTGSLYMPFLITAVFEGLLGALIVPILCSLYLLNRLVVRIGRWQIVRSEVGLSLMTKHGWSLLVLPVIVLLAMLQAARTAYCGG